MKRWAKSRGKAVNQENKETLFKRLSFSESTKSSILRHILRGKRNKKANTYLGLALFQDFSALTILPKRQAPSGQSVPQASSAPPFASALQSACNGLVRPAPAHSKPKKREARPINCFRRPPTLPPHPGPLAGHTSPPGTAHLHRPRRLVAPPLRS